MSELAREPLIPGEVVDLQARGAIEAVKDDVRGLTRSVEGLRTNMATHGDITALGNTVNSLRVGLDEARAPKPGLMISYITLGLTFLVIVGGFAYWPIKSEQAETKEQIRGIKDHMVPREEINYRAAITNGRFAQLDTIVGQLQARDRDDLVREIERLRTELRSSRPQ